MAVSNMSESAETLNDEMTRAVLPVTVFVGVEVVVAFFGNLVVLYVFLFRYPKSNFRYFVLCLTFIDITCALTTMPGEMLTQTHWYVYPYPIICKIKSFFNMFTVSSEAFCFLTIAIDRHRKICHPHGWQIRIEVAKWLCLAIYATGFVVSLPVAFFWGTHKEKEAGNITTTVCEKDQRFTHTTRPFEYSVSIESILAMCLAFVLLLYILIARTIVFQNSVQRLLPMKAETELKSSPTNEADNNSTDSWCDADIVESPHCSGASTSSDTACISARAARHSFSGHTYKMNTLHRHAFNERIRRKTLIMFILTITFIVTIILYLTLLSFIANGILSRLTDTQRAVYFFFFRFYFINHVINPIVYGVLDPHFRKVVRNWWYNKQGK